MKALRILTCPGMVVLRYLIKHVLWVVVVHGAALSRSEVLKLPLPN